MKCLLTIRADAVNPSIIFANGFNQNIKFFYDLLILMGHSPSFLVRTNDPELKLTFVGKDYRTISYKEALKKTDIDIVFEMGTTVDDNWKQLFREHCGAKIVTVRYGISLVMDMEQLAHPQTLPKGIHRNGPDFVWTSPHISYGLPYLETIYDAKGAICPYIWEPDFANKQFEGLEVPDVRDIYVMEPSVSIIKNALIPITIIEEVYRNNPSAFGKATIVNGMKYYKEEFFTDNIARNFSSVRAKANKVFFSPRAKFDEVFKRSDVLLGHQWGCELNYLYLETIFAGLPLVHNSESLQELGYYYPGFDTHKGKESCLEALHSHNEQKAINEGHKFLQRYSIHNTSVQKEYARLIEEVLDD
jgi:hypothetical protein